MNGAIDGIIQDLDEVFCFNQESTYQDRAHEYLRRRRLDRTFGDTAVQRVEYLVERTMDACSGSKDMKDRMIEEAARLLELAREMKE